MSGTIPLPRDAARAFKQQWQAGLVRLQGEVTAGGAVQNVALVSDGDGVVRECREGNCMTEQEHGRLERERLERERLERLERLIYTDPQTGLQWLRDANSAGRTMDWYDAMTWVKTLRVGGYTDWRLPTKEELEAFVKRAGKSPADYFNANGFNNVQSSGYWSSSTVAGYTGFAWGVDVINGYYVWPVRSGQ